MFSGHAEAVGHFLLPDAPLEGLLYEDETDARHRLGEDEWWWWFHRGWWTREEAEA